MSDATTDSGGGNPFSPRAVLALVLFGAAVFIALLWMIGSGMTGESTNNGGAHAGGKGLNGYAALANMLERRGHVVRRTRSERAFDEAGLLVLTPPHYATGEEIGKIIARHRYHGPTLLVLPKWQALPVPAALQPGRAHKGWVTLAGAQPPAWGDAVSDLGSLDLAVKPLQAPQARWEGFGRTGRLARPDAVQGLSTDHMVPLVHDDDHRIVSLVRGGDRRTLAGFLYDDGFYPVLAGAAGVFAGNGENEDIYPVVVVAEPDLVNNYGFADRDRAMLALALIDATTGQAGTMPVNFDLTLNGFKRAPNLLTLAFTPPFVAATLCLLLAALAVGWRAFLRFGPPRKAARGIAFGKRALVANAAGLIRRSGRRHLVTAPYATRARERLARALALPRLADAAATEAAIDRAFATRAPEAASFSATAARLRAARKPHDIMKAAQDLHALERMLIR
ncbi:MAG: DUF4350 domain-containing protein [Novosphingobium sp.]|jgi:hypothetical protein|nr:DUF4350 domain-containing protein [Novosphingobium sp.]